MYAYFAALLFWKGVKVSDVCKATGISQSTLSNWKKRNNKLSPDNLQKIADYFNVPVDYLVRGRALEIDEKSGLIIEITPEIIMQWGYVDKTDPEEYMPTEEEKKYVEELYKNEDPELRKAKEQLSIAEVTDPFAQIYNLTPSEINLLTAVLSNNSQKEFLLAAAKLANDTIK